MQILKVEQLQLVSEPIRDKGLLSEVERIQMKMQGKESEDEVKEMILYNIVIDFIEK